MSDYTQEWKEYQQGIDYKQKINLFAEVNKNERFYAGKQWEGVKSNGLPTPAFNVIKRVGQYKVSQIMQNTVAINYSVDGIDDNPENPWYQELKQVAEDLSDYTKTIWERLKMDASNESVLKDAYLTGDGIIFFYWDDSVQAGIDQEVRGDIAKEEIDNVNYFPGNPNDADVQRQPYIILAFRKMVSEVKKEAEANGRPPHEIDMITGDSDYEYQSGDRAKEELDGSQKCTVLLKLWKENGTVKARKSTRYAIIRDTWDTKLRRYPVALINWELRKNSCHGAAEVTEIIPNQIAINKLFAMAIISAMHTAFPKAIYDATRIAAVSNAIGTAIGVNGDISNAMTYLNPGQMSIDVYKMVDSLISYTKEMMGANEAALGEVDPKNTSAIIAVQKASAIPLESVKRRFYKYIEDLALIWIDFFINYYNVPRKLTVKRSQGVEESIEFDGSKYKDIAFNVKIDVGPSTQWSEITALQTLDNLLESNHITFKQYLERLPNGLVPQKQELIEEIEMEDMKQQFIFEIMSQFIETLPPDMQEQILNMPPEEQEKHVMQMMMQNAQPQAIQEEEF